MKSIGILFMALIFTSCATMTEKIAGYNGDERTTKLKEIRGLNATDAKAILGIPAAEGMCKDCGRKEGVYELVYLKETLPRYSFALSMTNKSALDCFIISFYKDEAKNDYIYDGGAMEQTGCAADWGVINRIRKAQAN